MQKPDTVFVKPSPGCKVRKGLGQPFLEDAGEHVERTIYWRRRIRQGDVVVTESPEPETIELETPPEAEAEATTTSPRRARKGSNKQ